MTTKQVYFNEEEEQKIKRLSKLWNIAEYEVVKRMVNEYREKEVKK